MTTHREEDVDINAVTVQASTFGELFNFWRKSVEILPWIWNDLFSRDVRHHLKVMFAYMLTGSIVLQLLPRFMEWLTQGLQDQTPREVRLCFYVMVASFLVGRLTNWGREHVNEVMLVKRAICVPMSLTRLFFAQPPWRHKQEGGRLSVANLKTLESKVDQVGDTFTQGLLSLLSLATAIVMLATLSMQAGLLAVGMVVFYLLGMLVLSRKLISAGSGAWDIYRALDSMREDRMRSAWRILLSGRSQQVMDQLESGFDRWRIADNAIWLPRIAGGEARGMGVATIAVVILGNAILQAIHGSITPYAVVPILFLTLRIYNDLWRIGTMENVIRRCALPILAMKTELEQESDMQEGSAVPDRSKAPEIVLNGVCYAHAGADRDVLHKVSLTVPGGKMTAFVGTTGAGKSTLANLLSRGAHPRAGQILVNGVPLRTINARAWGEFIGRAEQTPSPLTATVRWNLLFELTAEQRETVTDQQMISVLKRFKIWDRFQKDRGLETEIGENGADLSGGEAQRLILAGIYLKNPMFIIADEPTSALDALTEQIVQRVFDEWREAGKTILLIAHRLGTVESADQIVVLRSAWQDGAYRDQVEAIGTYQELAVTVGSYLNLQINAHKSGAAA